MFVFIYANLFRPVHIDFLIATVLFSNNLAAIDFSMTFSENPRCYIVFANMCVCMFTIRWECLKFFAWN